jgi:two-component system, NtrC family, sensor kinase
VTAGKLAELEAELAARDRTIAALIEGAEQRFDHIHELDLMVRMASLEHVVSSRTAELGRQKETSERALADLHATQAQLLQAQRLEAVGQLAAGIAHEINTPMQYIGDNARFLEKAFAEFVAALDTVDLDSIDAGQARKLKMLRERVPRALAGTIDGVESVSRIIQGMREFSHPGTGALSPCDLNQCLNSTANVSRNEWKYVAELELALDPDLPLVPALPQGLNQVFLNIIVNAAHAIGEMEVIKAGAKGKISVRTWADPDWVHVEIADDGPGVPAAIRDRVFDPFFTTKPVGKGTGQGLAIARAIVVDKHHGRLHLTSPWTATGGTCFTVSVPREQQHVSGRTEAVRHA